MFGLKYLNSYLSYLIVWYQVSRQLFEPLMKQLIHWFTSSKMLQSPVTIALLDTIMVCLMVLVHQLFLQLSCPVHVSNFYYMFFVLFQDGLVNPVDAALRDLSATCLSDFVKWSIKQSSKEVSRLLCFCFLFVVMEWNYFCSFDRLQLLIII